MGDGERSAARYRARVTHAPATGLFTRYVLENPWPLVVLLGIAAIALAKLGTDRDGRRLVGGAVACVLAAAVVFLTAWMVTTPGEHARRVTRALVTAAEAGDLVAMRDLFAADASLHLGSLAALGLDRDEIDRGIDTLGSQHRVASNTVTVLRAGPIDANAAVAELGNITTTASSFGPVPNAWLLRIERGSDGVWRIQRLSCTAIAGRAPSSRPW